MTSLNSRFLNYIIFRDLHESGFSHSAFSFGYEVGINKSTIDGNLVPPGALVKFVQKGIQYLELETNRSNDDTNMEDFQFLEPLDLLTKNVHELQIIIKEKKEKLQKGKSTQKGKGKADHKRNHKEKQQKEKECERDRKRSKEAAGNEEKEKHNDKEKPREDIMDSKLSGQKEAGHEEHGKPGDLEPMDICIVSASLPCEIPTCDVTILEGHTSEVFVCAWSPEGSLLASGSADSTARIWTIGDAPCNSTIQRRPPNVLVLKHLESQATVKNKDITSLEWNSEGTLLATGFSDGQARVWNRSGELVSTFNKHEEPIISLKWNKKGDYLLSGSIDTTALVWNVKSGEPKQQFDFHLGPLLDVAWQNNDSFATSSIDKMIYVCKVGVTTPVRTLNWINWNEINVIKWYPSGSLLASCSDDTTVKIWSMKQDVCLHDFKEHRKEIYTIKWSPTGAGSSNLNKQLLLASASNDSTVKLWDVELGRLFHSLDSHRESVYAIAFSPNSEYLASGSLDKCMNISLVKEAKIVRTYNGDSGIFYVSWNKEGNKVAACFANKKVCVFDIRV